MYERGGIMAHKIIDTVTRKGGKRRQVKSMGHNDMNSAKIEKSRAKAIQKVTPKKVKKGLMKVLTKGT